MPNRILAPLIPGILTVALLCAATAGPRAEARTATAQEDPPGSLTVLTRNGDDEPIPGACYDLFVDDDGPTDFVAEQCDAYDGATDGTTVFVDVPAGEYVMEQIFVPAGYKVGKDRSLTIAAGEETAYTFRTPRGGRTVTLSLRDDAGQPLPGGCYSLYPVADDSQPGLALNGACDFYDGADDGATTLAGLDSGDYLVILSSPPAGYTIPTGQRVAAGGDGVDLVFDVALGGETVTIANVDAAGEPVPGSCHRVYTGDGDGGRSDLIALGCDHFNGAGDGSIAIIGLLPGAYVLVAPPASDGSVVPDDIPFQIVAGSGAQVEVMHPLVENGTPAP